MWRCEKHGGRKQGQRTGDGKDWGAPAGSQSQVWLPKPRSRPDRQDQCLGKRLTFCPIVSIRSLCLKNYSSSSVYLDVMVRSMDAIQLVAVLIAKVAIAHAYVGSDETFESRVSKCSPLCSRCMYRYLSTQSNIVPRTGTAVSHYPGPKVRERQEGAPLFDALHFNGSCPYQPMFRSWKKRKELRLPVGRRSEFDMKHLP